jgi:hypothetical protein
VIYVRLLGGLGNQMFQYAMGKRVSLDLGVELTLDHSHFSNHQPGEAIREYELDCFRVNAKHIFDPAEERTQKRRFFMSPKLLNTYIETSPAFNAGALKQSDDTLYVGYWQNEQYFKKIRSTIRHDFTFIKPLSKAKQAVSAQIKNTPNSTALQIRRGDYATNENSNKFHGLAPLAYYDRAIKELTKKIRQPTFFVISDDDEWCRKNLKLGYPTVFVKHVPGTGQEDMNLMSQCQHQIIANSSYGWWAAWLNKNPNKIIIAPKIWFQDKTANRQIQIVPKAWIRL